MQHIERAEQIALIDWFRLQYKDEHLIISASGGSRSKIEAMNLKKSGLEPGIPDILLPVPRGQYNGFWIELKRPRSVFGAKGKITASQMAMMGYLTSRGFKCELCFGWVAASEVIKNYMESENEQKR